MIGTKHHIKRLAMAILMTTMGGFVGAYAGQNSPLWHVAEESVMETDAAATVGTDETETSKKENETQSKSLEETKQTETSQEYVSTQPKKEDQEEAQEEGLDGDFLYMGTAPTVSEAKPLSVIYFNLAFLFPEGADVMSPLESYGGSLYQELSKKDAEWLSGVYRYMHMKPEKAATVLGYSSQKVRGRYDPRDEDQDPNKPETWTLSQWETIKMNVRDGNGSAISGYSNVKDIMAMASVYTFYQDYQNVDLFATYINQLWKKSHNFQVKISDVYFCEGCLKVEEQYEADSVTGLPVTDVIVTETEALDQEQTLSSEWIETPTYYVSPTQAGPGVETLEPVTEPSESATETAAETLPAIETLSKQPEPVFYTMNQGQTGAYTEESTEALKQQESAAVTSITITCPGHIDLTIQATIVGTQGKRNLYTIDTLGKGKTTTENGTWMGWDDTRKQYVAYLAQQDWNAYYGISIASMLVSNPLSVTEVSSYMELLPEDLSEDRKRVVRYALESVGKVPYYYGGKAKTTGYQDNQFGTVTSPDEKGRRLKGLDCSGWVNWVYESAIQKELTELGTDGLARCGTTITRDQLQPGDIVVRLGENSHTVMFLAWDEDDKMICIHETGGTTNNITISKIAANWPYYRKLIE